LLCFNKDLNLAAVTLCTDSGWQARSHQCVIFIYVIIQALACQANAFYETPFSEEQNGFLCQLETPLTFKQDPESFCMEWKAFLAFLKKSKPRQQILKMTAKSTEDFRGYNGKY